MITRLQFIDNGSFILAKVATLKRTRGGGGAARRASRTSISYETAKFIERKIPLFEVLNEEDCTFRGGRFRLLGVNK